MAKIEIELNHKSATFLAALKTVDDDARSRMIAVKEGRGAPGCGNPRCGAHGDIAIPPVRTDSQIASDALALGLSIMLNRATAAATVGGPMLDGGHGYYLGSGL